ncbi:MAG: TIGR03960 family B12-binding radical SAM protein [Myxococcota bacterium]
MSERPREHPYAPFLHRVRKPGRYIGGETGERRKPWDAVRARMCLAFPDLYEIGMSHLGYKILYGILNDHEALLGERCYAPWADMEAELRAREEPLRSLESAQPLSCFDVVGFSLQYELTYTNVLLMLDLGGIPLRSSDRGDGDPLVVAGGPTATHAEPMAPFVDAFLIGDGEVKVPELLLTWAALRDAGVPRRERLEQVAQLGGWYVPSLYDTAPDPETGLHVVARPRTDAAPLPVQRAIVGDLSDHPFPHDGPVAATETTFDRVSVEIARGCTEGCRFCQAGMIYRPVRERRPEHIVEAVERAVREGGYDEASLTSLSTADYSAIAPLVKKTFAELGDHVALGVSSLRAYGLAEDVLDTMSKTRATGLTFAPEAGTQRMRDVVNKNVTEEQLLETAERVFSRGWSKMKLYFMIGLPTEEDEDVRGIVETGAKALAVARRVQKGRRARVTVSVSTHVPKPHTPFQWCAMDPLSEILRKQAILREEAAKHRGVQLRMHDSSGSWLEGVLARGDRRLAAVVESAYEAGARFDSWDDRLKLDAWRAAFDLHGLDPAAFLGTLPTSGRLPWDHIDVGLEEGFLAKEYRKSLANRLSPPCGKAAGMFVHHTNAQEARADGRRLVCYDCGVACDMSQMRRERVSFLESLGAEAPAPPPEPRPTGKVEPKDRRPPGTRAQGPFVRVRLGYTRTGRNAYQGHLDMVRLLPRIFRRAGLPLYYTQGFHPKPDMTFGPALPLGTASLAEHLDLKLRHDAGTPLDADALVARLNEAAFDGVCFTGARFLGPQHPGIQKVIDEAVYVAGLPRSTLDALELDGAGTLASRIAARRDGDLVVLRDVKGIGKKIDVASYLIDVRPGEGREVLERAGIAGDLLPVTLRLRVTQQGTARPPEALSALLGTGSLDDVHARWVRAEVVAHRDGARLPPLALPPARPKARAATEEPAAASAPGVASPPATP